MGPFDTWIGLFDKLPVVKYNEWTINVPREWTIHGFRYLQDGMIALRAHLYNSRFPELDSFDYAKRNWRISGNNVVRVSKKMNYFISCNYMFF